MNRLQMLVVLQSFSCYSCTVSGALQWKDIGLYSAAETYRSLMQYLQSQYKNLSVRYFSTCLSFMLMSAEFLSKQRALVKEVFQSIIQFQVSERNLKIPSTGRFKTATGNEASSEGLYMYKFNSAVTMFGLV